MVVSAPITGAAIIGGELVLSLPSGQIINCGLVQGPPGPKGSVGSPGPKGDAGLDGCTLLHGPGFPDPAMGKSGDFYWMVSPEVGVFGPKTAGGWGSPVILSRPITASKADYKPIAGQSGGGGSTGDGSGPSKVYTNQVIPTGSGRLKGRNNKTAVEYFGSPNGILAPSGPLNSQANINGWIVKALEELDAVVPVAIVDTLPTKGEYTGDLVLCEGSLHIWAETEWVAVSSQGGAVLSDIRPVGDFEEGALWFCTADDDLTLYVYLGDGADQGWVPAAPPVSLDGIESNITLLQEANDDVKRQLAYQTIEAQKSDLKILDLEESQERQDGQIATLETELGALQRNFDRGKWNFVKAKPTVGQYALGVKLTREYCEDQYLKCLDVADNDPLGIAECNRIASECETAKDNGESTYTDTWGGVDHISIHTSEADGEIHGFADYTVGKYIEIFNEGDEGNAVYQITEDAVITDGIAVVAIADIQHTGKPNGLGRFKVFEMEAGDPTEYVRKSGDTMTGSLKLKNNQTNAELITRFINSGEQSKLYIKFNNETRLIVGNDDISAEKPVKLKSEGTQDKHAVTKGYVDIKPLGIPFKWVDWVDDDTAKKLKKGEFTYSNGSNGGYAYIGSHDANGIEIFTNGNRDADFTGMLKAYDGKKSLKMAIRFKNIEVAKYQNGSNHVAKYNIAIAYRFSAENLNAGQVYYLKDGCWL